RSFRRGGLCAPRAPVLVACAIADGWSGPIQSAAGFFGTITRAKVEMSAARVLVAGETVQHYRVLEKIGEGGMGVVYKALDTRLDRPVAIKVLRSTSDPSRRLQFAWEARAAASLRHPHIVVI